MSSPSDPLWGTLRALFGGQRTAPDGTIIKPPVDPGAPAVEMPHLPVPPYVPWSAGNRLSNVDERNAAFDQLIPLISLVLQTKNFNTNFVRVQQSPNPPYVYPVLYIVRMAEFGSTLGIYNGALMLYTYDACKGDPTQMAERLAVGYNCWKAFTLEQKASGAAGAEA